MSEADVLGPSNLRAPTLLNGLRVCAAVLVLVVATLAIACNSDNGSLSAEEYFAQVESIAIDAGSQYAQLSDERAPVFDTALDIPTRKQASSVFLDAYGAIVVDTHARLEELRAPSDLKEDHRRFVEAQAQFQPPVEKAKTASMAASSAVELEDVFAVFGADFDVANEPFRVACLALQTHAEGKGIMVDLRCG